jgi:hypothetical protein
VFVYIKEYEGNKTLVILNFTKHPVRFDLPSAVSGLVVESHIGNYSNMVEISEEVAKLRSYEAVALQYKQK